MRFPVLSLVTISLLLVGCGVQDNASLKTDDSAPLKPVLIVSGGNSSCERDENKDYTPVGMGMYSKFQQLLADTAERSIAVDYVLTCYRNYNETFDVHYIFSDDPDTIHVAPREDFYVDLDRFLDVTAPGPIIMAGHSYGGWLTMRAVIDLNREFEAAYTLDAISQVECRFTRPFGCTSDPRDIKADERQLIRDNTGIWANFYQTQTFYLHSGKMEHADRNHRLSTSHNGIKTRNEIWDSIYARTVAAAGQSFATSLAMK